jgi:CHAT domain-containing protein
LRIKKSLTTLESELYLDVEQLSWLNKGSDSQSRLLARQLEQNHADRWLTDYISARRSPAGNTLLESAARANKHADPSGAIISALSARRLFRRVGNSAGIFDARFQQVYALHRLSKAQECSDQAARTLPGVEKAGYYYLFIQLNIEFSGCEAMLGHFAQARDSLNTAMFQAKQHRFSVLLLRALGYEAGFETAEGRLQRSWMVNEAGLTKFWSDSYPSERGFQFYSDLESVAEEQDSWHLAAALESESIALLANSGMADVEAIAHYRLANLEMTFGATTTAEHEYMMSQALFQKIPSEATRRFYYAYAEVGLAGTEIANGQTRAAHDRLERVEKVLQNQSNVMVQLPFLKARAELERQLGNRNAELRYLGQAAKIGSTGSSNLGSASARWEWQQEVGQVYRRLLDIETHSGHDPEQTMADWELFRVRGVLDTSRFGEVAIDNSRARDLLRWRLGHLTTATLIVIAAFPADLTIWVANHAGVQEIHVPIELGSIQRQLRLLRVLCSDPASPPEKVNALSLRLYQLLLKPAFAKIEKGGPVFLETDDELGLFPVSALTRMEGGVGSTSLVRIPGLFYQQFKLKQGEGGDFLIANPGGINNDQRYSRLPSADKEIDVIGRLFSHTVYLRGTDLTLDKLLRELSGASRFHFAGHAINRGFMGELILNGNSLTAAEVEKIRTPNMLLVTLAACSTANNVRGVGTDPNGLVSAFLRAGTRRVLASYWDVNSAYTSDLMSAFYRVLAQGVTPETALLAASDSVHGSGHPYYWASFDVFGTIGETETQ